MGLTTQVDLDSDTIKVLLCDVTITFNVAHEFVSDLSGAGIVARSAALTTKVVTGGVFDADDVVATAVTGATITALILVKDTGSDATSPLVCFLDGITPYGPTGGNITITWSVSGIFAI